MSEPELLNLGTYRPLERTKSKVGQKALLPSHHLVTHGVLLGMGKTPERAPAPPAATPSDAGNDPQSTEEP